MNTFETTFTVGNCKEEPTFLYMAGDMTKYLIVSIALNKVHKSRQAYAKGDFCTHSYSEMYFPNS